MSFNIHFLHYHKRAYTILCHQEIIPTGNTWERQHSLYDQLDKPTAIGSSHLEFNLIKWPMIFSKLSKLWFYSPIKNQELLITGWTESHT